MLNYYYIDRQTKEQRLEKVYGGSALSFLYGPSKWGNRLAALFSTTPFISSIYGLLQKSLNSKKRIDPFIKEYEVRLEDFIVPKMGYSSFNDFFIRKVKKEARPICKESHCAILPADARYKIFQSLGEKNVPLPFYIKGVRFSLENLLNDSELAKLYESGSAVFARLAPPDYHRFHFCASCIPSTPKLINGSLYSVNPLAFKKFPDIFEKNKRVLTLLQTEDFGQVAMLEIGATNVGSIVETFTPNKFYAKGDEKGYFEFGGSALILLFEPGRIQFDADLTEITKQGYEVLAKMGESLGLSTSHFGQKS